ncbi:hypothetical protein ACWC4D_33495 [Streptomyces sp. NPDC001288]
MTGSEYREQHGDPAGWDDTEYEVFQTIAQPGPPAPTDHDLAA